MWSDMDTKNINLLSGHEDMQMRLLVNPAMPKSLFHLAIPPPKMIRLKSISAESLFAGGESLAAKLRGKVCRRTAATAASGISAG